MRISYDHVPDAALAPVGVLSVPAATAAADPTAPDLGFLTAEFALALQSFYATVDRIVAANPIDAVDPKTRGLQAVRQGKALGAVIGLFLKFKPYSMLAEIRQKETLFQPAFGPIVVVDGSLVRDVFGRHDEFTVDPYGVEMKKVMTPAYNGGFDTFILSTDKGQAYEPDRALLSAVCNRNDATAITGMLHDECRRRVGAAVASARASGTNMIDVVPAIARCVPVAVGHRYLGVPVGSSATSFELTSEMLTCYGQPIDGLTETALGRNDGIVPDEPTMYQWIKAAFQHFFNNVQKDRAVMIAGLRSCRLLLAYLLREIDIQRRRIQAGQPVADTMLTRLVRFQLGQSAPGATPPADLDPVRVNDLRIAENVMGTIVGAVAGQEEATCRVLDAMMRLQAGEYATSGAADSEYGSYDEARRLALNVMRDPADHDSRQRLGRYAMEALRLEPQGEVLLRQCVAEGATIGDSRPIRAGTLVFVSHGAAMKDVPEPHAFVLNRAPGASMPYGSGRHTCLGQFVSPAIIVESMVALLALEGLQRPEPNAGEPAFPLERRLGRLQLDDNNLYATTFSLQFADAGTTRECYPA
jgi:cytochrome P450